MHPVGINNSCDELPRLEPTTIEHGLAGIGSAHDDIRSFDDSLGTAYRLYLDVQQLCHFFREPFPMFSRTAVYLNRLDISNTTNGFQVSPRLIPGTKQADHFGIFFGQSPV